MSSKEKIIIIGNGMAGLRLCERLIELNAGESYTITVFGDERYPAYDRVHLSDYFQSRDAESLNLKKSDWYKENDIALYVGKRIASLDTAAKTVSDSEGTVYSYDRLVLSTGSRPFVPPIPGADKKGVFVYRTIDDLKAIAAYAENCKQATVLGGGLLGLEAAKASLDLGLETHVAELAPRLMPRQLDETASAVLLEKIENLGVRVHLQKMTSQIEGNGSFEGLRFSDDSTLKTDMLIISAGIVPRDELAQSAGMEVGERGGIVVDDKLQTSVSNVYALGEVALHRGSIHGLVAPAYTMADVLARNLTGGDKIFEGYEPATSLKLIGVDVASFGDALAEKKGARKVSLHNSSRGIYKKIVLNEEGTAITGAMLVGDASDFGKLQAMSEAKAPVPEEAESLLVSAGAADVSMELPDSVQICKCNDVTVGTVRALMAEGITDLEAIKKKTTAGSGCGGCAQLLAEVRKVQLGKMGVSTNQREVLCEHFDYTRQEIFDIIRVKKIKSYKEFLSSHGKGLGCEICKPLVASLLASAWNDYILKEDFIQDTNDRFLANIQRGGSYSIIPRVPGGEVTPEQLIQLGETARKFKLYGKITGGQRIGFLGARVEELPAIFEELSDAGFESGHAYGKAMRTVKSCVGSTWCRFGVQDSTTMAIKLEERYKGLRAPHKMKSGVSGCIRECAEAQSKDFGIIATEKGWSLYVCGNGGIKPRHTDLLASDLDEETLLKYIDRFLMYYIRTADKLTRTATWLDNLEGGIEKLKSVVIDDSLGICAELEADMQRLADAYKCEWRETAKNPEHRARFRHFVNSNEGDEHVKFEEPRGMKNPVPWTS